MFTTIERAVEGYTVADAITNLQRLGFTREAQNLADFARSHAEDFNLDQKVVELIAERFSDEISRWETAVRILYAEKTALLAPYTPVAIHVINKRKYWYYEIDGWKFHSPIPEEQTSAELRNFAAHKIEPRELNDSAPLNVAISDATLLPLIHRFGSMTVERINELCKKWQEREERFAARRAKNKYYDVEDDENEDDPFDDDEI